MTGLESVQAYAGQLAEAAALAQNSAAKQHEYVHGSSTSDVLTESGPVPTLAKQAVIALSKVMDALKEVAAQMQGAMTYDNIADGLKGTQDGGYFTVPSPKNKELLIFYRNTNGIAVEVDRSANASAIEEITKYFEQIDSRNDVMFGIADGNGNLGIALTNDVKLNIGNFKDVVGHIQELEKNAPEISNDRSGNLASFCDMAGALAVAIKEDGSLENKGRNLLKEIDELKSSAANNKWITPSKHIASFGDSMSENSWQPYLRLLMPDRNIYAGGIGGQKSNQIARRQGGVAPMVSIADNIIPASGGVTVTVDVPFLNNSTKLLGRLYGVFGTLSSLNNVYTFTRAKSGVAVHIDDITPFLISPTDYDYDFRTTVIWAGNNDPVAEHAQTDSNLIRMVEYLKPLDKRFVVLGIAIADYPSRHKGTPYYDAVMALHQKWRERWPNNFIDITQVLRRNYDPGNETDLKNMIDGCTPSSLREPGDPIHSNAAGKIVIADAIFNFIKQRGW